MIRSVVRVAAAVTLAGELWTGAAIAQTDGPRMLVIPFENPRRDASIFWLSEASAVLMADYLNALGAPAFTREERLKAFERLQIPPNASLTDATVIRIGQLVGASGVVIGSLHLEGDALVVRARSIALDTGRISREVVERGSMAEMFRTFERVARGIAPPASTARTGALEAQQPPLGVLETYIKGLLAETPATAVNYLNAALAGMPTFDRARLALWDVHAEEGDHARALAAVAPVAPASALGRRATFLAALSYLHLGRHDDAFSAFKSLVDAQPSAAASNNMGVVQLRRGATSESGRPVYYFTKAAEADATDPDYFFNLGYAYWLDRDPQAAVYWLREAVRRDPADGDAHFVLGTALAAGGSAAEAAREKDLARRLSSAYEEWERRPPTDAVPKGLERIKDGVELAEARQIEAALATSGQRDQRELARFYLDRGRRLFQEQRDREAIGELNRTLFLSPYEAEAHLLLGRIHLRNNRPAEAIDALKIALWSAETAEAHIALGEAYLLAREYGLARTEAERATALDPASSDARQLLGRVPAQ